MNVSRVNHAHWIMRLLTLGIASLLLLHSSSFSQNSSGSKTVSGMIAYYDVVPSQIIGTHPPTHPEAIMHGSLPTRRQSHHFIAALFERESLKRVTNV